MNKKFILFVFLILMASIGFVSADDNDTAIEIESHDLVKYYKNNTQFRVTVSQNNQSITNANVNFNLNGNSYNRTTNSFGIAQLNINLNPGNYSIITQYKNVSVKNNITVLSILDADDLIKYYKNDSQYHVNLVDGNGNAFANQVVTFNINGIFYNRTTNSLGIAKLNINLNPGDYVITSMYNGLLVSNNISVLPVLFAQDLVKYYRNGSQYYFKLLNNIGLPLANTNVTLNVNGVFYTKTTNLSGFGKLNINLNPQTYIITATYNGYSISNAIEVLSFLKADDLTKSYGSDLAFLIKVLNKTGSPLDNAKVLMNINGVFYTKTTNSSGIARLNINLPSGEYIITSSYDNLDVSNIIKVFDRLTGSDVTSTYGNSVDFKVKLLDNLSRAMSNHLVTFTVNSDVYNSYTDSNGIASVNLNYKAGNYLITYTSDGIIRSNSYIVKNYYTLTTYAWGSGADVTANSLIKANIPDSDLVKQVINAAKSGTPMVTFKGGDGKSVFITAGVHGNELSSQVAAIQLITYLENTPIDGTVYLMPFVQPKATASNVRNYNNVNLNAVANVAGTISNNIVKLIVDFKCDSYGDFHCTRPNGDPGKNVAMGSYSPTYESATIAKYISSKTGFSYLIYSVAGSEYPGALEDAVNIKGIPAVTCEVLTPHGTIASGSVEKSLLMMKALLNYNLLC